MDSLLELLRDGKFHSGEALGEALGVSRAAVWKQLKKIEALGVRLESVRGRGYRMDPSVQLIDKNELEKALKGAGLVDIELLIKRTTGSTNDDAAAYCVPQLKSFPVVLAEYQQAGRGRRGRQWMGRFGANIYLSTVWRCSTGAAALEGLSLVVGVSVVESLEALGYRGLQLKWPNDILHEGAKLAGVLIEVRGDMMGDCFAIIGLGLNLHLDDEERLDIGQPATSLADLSNEIPNKQEIAAELIARLKANLDSFAGDGFASFVDRWQGYDAYAGIPVRVISGPHQVFGTGRGIAENGSYILETESGPYYCQGGEISIRGQV